MDKAQTQQSQTKSNGNHKTHVSKTRSSEKPSRIHSIPNRSPIGELSPPNSPTSRQLFQMHKTLGNRAVGRMIQAKLTIGRPDDEYEREADRVADQVMRMPEPVVQQKPG